MRVNLLLVWFTLLLVSSVAAKLSLLATSLVTCMENSQISPTYFNVTFNPDDRSLRYSLDIDTTISGKVKAHVQVYAYGFLIIQKDVDLCKLGWKQFCPLYPGSIQIDSVEYLSKTDVKQIPGIAYRVPDIDAVVRIDVYDSSTGEKVSCIQSSFSNGKTVSQTGAKWATAVVAGLGLLIAAILSTFGNSSAAAHISANAVSLFLYFQSVVIVSMQSVERVPPIASAWATNLAWSMGLIRVTFMQKIFRWYVQATGGTPDLYFNGTTQQVLVQRAYNIVNNMAQRASDLLPDIFPRNLNFSLSSNSNLIVLRGIKRIGFQSHIEPTSIVVTGFTFFVLCGYVLVVVVFFLRLIFYLIERSGKHVPFGAQFRKNFSQILKGSMLRYIYIGFTQLIILSLWEFVQRDSAAVIVLACLFLLLSLGMIGYANYRTWFFGKTSIAKFKNPAALLYGDPRVLDRYGFCYTMFNAQKYWFGLVLMGYTFLKALFIAFCQNSGKVSSVAIFVIDLFYTAFLIWKKPYLDKSTNIVNYCMSVVNTLNSFLFMFFSDLFGERESVASIMGWIFFILNAAFSLILLVMIIVLIVLSLISKNPDARFAPAQDDRTSFQRKTSVRDKNGTRINRGANELTALGAAAQDHTANWESEMYKLHDMSQDQTTDEKATSTGENLTDSYENVDEKPEKSEPNRSSFLGAKWKNRFSRKPKTPEPEMTAAELEESTDHLNPNTLSFPRDNSNVQISLHNRQNSGFSAFSTNPTIDEPTNTRGIV